MLPYPELLKSSATEASAITCTRRALALIENKMGESYPEVLRSDRGRAAMRVALPVVLGEVCLAAATAALPNNVTLDAMRAAAARGSLSPECRRAARLVRLSDVCVEAARHEGAEGGAHELDALLDMVLALGESLLAPDE